MKKLVGILCCFALIIACDADSVGSDTGFSSDISGSGDSSGTGTGQAGVVTAGEWNDLEHWDFWRSLLQNEEYSAIPSVWGIYNQNRIDVVLTDTNQQLVNNAVVELLESGQVIWSSRTDNFGKAVLWYRPFDAALLPDLLDLELRINNQQSVNNVQWYPQGVNSITIPIQSPPTPKIELSFIIDATGSMGDELEFLKSDLQDVVASVQRSRANSQILLSTVFYRDQGDDYVTRSTGFTDQISTVTNFIADQSAAGGGDFPEAVHKGLEVALNDFQWSESATTRIAFLLLDAPPHRENLVLQQMRNHAKRAALLGVKIVPVTASGIDKPTEFLMRNLAQLTNGTYVFITDDSGVGNSHLEPSVGDYEVELLNDLMVRLIEKYSQE